MTEARPFSIRIFLPHGTPEGLRIIDKSNWTGCGVVCPRPLFQESKEREEFSRTGVYVLVGPSEQGDDPMLYIGEGDPVGPRLEQHHSKKDFWTWLVCFTSKDGTLNKAHVQHLEARLIELAREAKRADLENATSPKLPSLSEAERADAESFLADMLSIFPLVGLSAFEKPKAPRRKRDLLFLSGKGITAKGYESAEGFVVLKGSTGVSDEVPSIHRYLSTRRRELVQKGVLIPTGDLLELTQDYSFESPSTAAGILLGRSANGRIEWKDRQGRTLREIQEAAAA